jgi:hypothetical protein
VGVVRLMGSLSQTQSLIFERVDPKACIHFLKVKSLISLRSPYILLGHPYKTSKGESPILFMRLDLILNNAIGSN